MTKEDCADLTGSQVEEGGKLIDNRFEAIFLSATLTYYSILHWKITNL